MADWDVCVSPQVVSSACLWLLNCREAPALYEVLTEQSAVSWPFEMQHLLIHVNRNLARSLLFGRRNIVWCAVLTGLADALMLEKVHEPDWWGKLWVAVLCLMALWLSSVVPLHYNPYIKFRFLKVRLASHNWLFKSQISHLNYLVRFFFFLLSVRGDLYL